MKYGEIEITNLRERPRYLIKPGEFVIVGRSQSADITLKNDQTVSRLHCKIYHRAQRFWIENKSSRNTIVNGKIIEQPQPLQQNDTIQIGNYQMAFHLVDMVEAVSSVAEPFAVVKRGDKLTAKIAVRLGLLNQAQAKEAINRQLELALEGPYYPLEEILSSENYLSAQDLAKIQDYRRNIPYRIPNYELKELIGMGGAGHVYIAQSLNTNETVACKIFSAPNSPHERQLREQFLKESAILLQLHHPNIVEGIESGEAHGTPYIIMEYVNGPTLQQYLKDQGGRLLPEEAILIVLQVAQALDYANQQGKIHRDIKPENILLNQDHIIKLCDFGLARNTNRQDSQEESVFGTLSYMSPEQIQGQTNVDIRSDIYSLGGVFYRLLFGKLPFQRDSKKIRAHQYEPEVLQFPADNAISRKTELTDILRKMMVYDQQQRYQTPGELMMALVHVRDQFSQTDRELMPTEEMLRPDHEALLSKKQSNQHGMSPREMLQIQPPTAGTTNNRMIPDTRARKSGGIDDTREQRLRIDATQERPRSSRRDGTEHFAIPPKPPTQTWTKKIVIVLAVLAVLSVSMMIYFLSTGESRLLTKFWNAAHENHLKRAENIVETFAKEYPQSLHLLEIKEQLQKMLWDEAYNKPVENRLAHAQPLCVKIRAILPDSEMAQKANLWIQQLEQEERKAQELKFLESKLAQLNQWITTKELEQAKTLWGELENRWMASEIKSKALEAHNKLDEQLLLTQIKPFRFYIATEFDTSHCQDVPPEPPLKNAGSLLVYSRGILAQPLKLSGYFLSSSQGICHCLAANDGRILWSMELPGTGRYAWNWCNAQNQEVTETRLATKVLLSRLGGSELQLVNIADGKTSWRKSLISTITAPPSILGGDLFVPCSNNYCYRLSLTGKLQGGFLTREPIAYSPTLSSQNIYLTSSDYGYEFSLMTGELTGYLRWNGKAIGPILPYNSDIVVATSQSGQTFIHKFTSANTLDQTSTLLLRPPAKTASLANTITAISPANTSAKIWLLSSSEWILFEFDNNNLPRLPLPNANQTMPILMLPQNKEIIGFLDGLHNYKITPDSTAHFPKLPLTLPKLTFTGQANQWQTTGEAYAMETYQDQESWLQVFTLSANTKQLLWQRRMPGAITSILHLERERSLWITHHDGGLTQAVNSAQSFYPSLKVQRGWITGDIASYLLPVPQTTGMRIALIRNRGGSQLLKTTGAVIQDWNLRENLENLSLSPLQVQGKTLLVPLEKKIMAFSLVSGRPMAEPVNHSQIFTSPLAYFTPYVLTGDAAGNFQAWQIIPKANQISLSKVWTFTASGAIYAAPAMSTKAVYIGDATGHVYCLQPKTGQKIWEYQAQGNIQGCLWSGTMVYIGTAEGKCYALDANTGKLRWQQDLKGEVITKPIMGKNKLYWAIKPNAVVALNPNTGSILWTMPTRGAVHPESWCFLASRIYAGTQAGWLMIIRDMP